MPTTRTRAQAINAEKHQEVVKPEHSHTNSTKASRSACVIQQHRNSNDDESDTNPRSAKRRRMENPLPTIQNADISLVDHVKETRIDQVAAVALGQSAVEDGPEKQSPMGQGPTPTDPRQSRLNNLPRLDKLARQILSSHAKLSPQEVGSLIANPTSDAGREYLNAQSHFTNTKLQYSNIPFLSSSSLRLQKSDQIETLRKANLATFISSLFNGHIGLEELDRHFIEVFVPEEGRLLKVPGSLWLELKTQAFIASIVTSDKRPTDEVLAQLFTKNVEDQMLSRRPGAKGLAPSEQDFLVRMTSRREFLAAEMNKDPASNLPAKYKWDNFLREASLYVGKIFENVSAGPENNGNPNITQRPEMHRGQMEGSFSMYGAATDGESLANTTPDPPKDDFVARAARAAQIALHGPGKPHPYSVSRPTPPPPSPRAFSPPQYQQVRPTFQHYSPTSSSIPNSRPPNPPPPLNSSGVPHSSQTAPTTVLYERARLANKPSPNGKKPSPNQRRPWTSEEEQALMEGLDRVHGPHWSQILSLFGAGGRENEKLKDRNQVQLKDKARNLKLFFLKCGIEVPFYLKNVTGDLESRAPTHAAKGAKDGEGTTAVSEDQQDNESTWSNLQYDSDVENLETSGE